MNTLSLSILSVLGVLILFGSRRWALLGMIAGILYLTQGLALNVAGFSLYPVRILSLVALVRILARREFPSTDLNRIDAVVVLIYAYATAIFLLRSDEGQVFQIGAALDALLLYFSFRTFVRTLDDFKWLLRGTAILLVPYVPLVWIESTTFQNSFAALGGVELARAGDLWVRDGRLRATGSFMHPSLLGTLGGTFLPLYVALAFMRGERRVALLGIFLCLGIVGASNSGGPAACVAVALIGWLLWPMRKSMRSVRLAMAASIALLALVMQAPIWYLIARLSTITGGDGYHRAVLLDIAFQRLDWWWLAGMPMRETVGWLPYNNTTTGFVDMTNNFLQFGINAGLGAMLLLIASLVVAYSHLGRAMAIVRSQEPTADDVEPLYWGLGVTLAVHIFNWFGITYWDQTNAVWFLHLALVGSLIGAMARADTNHRYVERESALAYRQQSPRSDLG